MSSSVKDVSTEAKRTWTRLPSPLVFAACASIGAGAIHAAVIGIPHPRWLERPLLVCVSRSGDKPTLADVMPKKAMQKMMKKKRKSAAELLYPKQGDNAE